VWGLRLCISNRLPGVAKAVGFRAVTPSYSHQLVDSKEEGDRDPSLKAVGPVQGHKNKVRLRWISIDAGGG
jgi:hypothetical protein